MNKLFDRLIYIELIFVLTVFIILISLFFPEYIPEVILFSMLDLFFPSELDAAFEVLRAGMLTQFFTNGLFLSVMLGLWFISLILLLKRKKIGILIFYFCVAMNIVMIFFGGDDIYTPFSNLINLIESYIVGALLFIITFSSLKREFK